jgi:hypothetical protein
LTLGHELYFTVLFTFTSQRSNIKAWKWSNTYISPAEQLKLCILNS